jgi:hypothetical protein
MTFKIERGVPPPKNPGRAGYKYPFPTMKVGESFVIPCTDDTAHRKQINVMASTRSHKPSKFRSAIERNSKGTHVRVWRIA